MADAHYSDEEISEKEHNRLLEAVSTLDKSQHIKAPTRTEPSLEISEYNLVKSSGGKNSTVNLHSLVKGLNKKSNQIEITKKINKVRRNVKTIPKPLEKPEAQKIKRSVGYANVKQSLDKWEPIVHAHRAAEQIEFPLRKDARLEVETTSHLMQRFRVKSEIELEMEKLQPSTSKVEEEKSEFPLTLAEMLERRREAAKLRAQQSYKEAKARRQSKIKSKKYHRVQRREKIKQQIKEFEYLQKNNPEEALKKLEEIEKARAEERASLRHRTTGKWAQSKQVRAKYDKESRQVLAQQLAVSRDLTQKMNNPSDSDNDDDQDNSINSSITPDNTSNPWINGIKPSAEVADFVSGYRKYWNEKTQNAGQVPEISSTTVDENKKVKKKSKKDSVEETPAPPVIVQPPIKYATKTIKILPVSKFSWVQPAQCTEYGTWGVEKLSEVPVLSKAREQPTKSEAPKKPTADDHTIEDIFKNVDDNLEEKLAKRVKKIKSDSRPIKKQKKDRKSKTKYVPDLSMKSQKRLRPDLDEGLIENGETSSPIEKTVPKTSLQKVETPDIDPSSFVQIEPKYLKSSGSTAKQQQLDDALDDVEDNNSETDEQAALISEAFEDDDIVADFRKEKKDEVDANTPKDIDLSLPGWGSWGGKNLKNKRKSKRFIVKQPKKMPRKDDNKGDLIIKEHKDVKVKGHQVNEVPFPFTSVKDFEASIRAPLGNTFLPETAHKRLVKPSVKIQSGAIIEPMDDSQLVANKIRKLKKGIL